MIKKAIIAAALWAPLITAPAPGLGAAITAEDSTQPRGAPLGNVNDQGQSLDPISEGFRAPAGFSGVLLPAEGHDFYRDWVGSMMGNTARDPAFYATLNIANQDIIDLYKSLDAAGQAAFRTQHQLPDNPDDELLPVTADICLRCHAPVGWLEAHSEPPTPAFPFLDGQFWGAALLEVPPSDPVDLLAHSEAEMEGVQCDFCHRVYDGMARRSLFDSSTLMAGNGSFFVSLDIPFRENGGIPDTVFPFQKDGDFCGICHDVTNPIIKTRTEVDGAVPDMLHPMERTYTEWYWSGYRDTRRCQECHAPMQFLGAQTWMLFPAMASLWGDIDQQWIDRGYDVPASRAEALRAAAAKNRSFMKSKAARMEILGAPNQVRPGDEIGVDIKVTNLTGHKLPTGFAEGRQMWIHLQAQDKDGKILWEDGALAAGGELVRSDQTKVYEQEILAEGYDFIDQQAKDLDGNGVISSEELEKAQHFHFVLMNKIVKDNRIPPKGYNKGGFQE